MLNSATKYIAKHEQKLITAGPADPRSCNRNGHIRIEHKYQSECIESDSRLWRHSTKCGYSRQLIYCPDTDAYMIGLTNHTKSTDIVVELTPIGSKDRKLLPMNELTDSLERDPELSPGFASNTSSIVYEYRMRLHFFLLQTRKEQLLELIL